MNKKAVSLLVISLAANTVSVILLFVALVTKYSLITNDFTQFVTMAMLNYLAGTLLMFVALGFWKRGIMLGKASITSGAENIMVGLLFVALLLQETLKAPIVLLPFLTGYGLIQQGRKAITLEKMEGVV